MAVQLPMDLGRALVTIGDFNIYWPAIAFRGHKEFLFWNRAEAMKFAAQTGNSADNERENLLVYYFKLPSASKQCKWIPADLFHSGSQTTKLPSSSKIGWSDQLTGQFRDALYDYDSYLDILDSFLEDWNKLEESKNISDLKQVELLMENAPSSESEDLFGANSVAPSPSDSLDGLQLTQTEDADSLKHNNLSMRNFVDPGRESTPHPPTPGGDKNRKVKTALESLFSEERNIGKCAATPKSVPSKRNSSQIVKPTRRSEPTLNHPIKAVKKQKVIPEVKAQPLTRKASDTIDPTLPWGQLFEFLKAEGWVYEYGTGLISSLYLRPGVLKANIHNLIERQHYFTSEDDVRDFVRRAVQSNSTLWKDQVITSSESEIFSTQVDYQNATVDPRWRWGKLWSKLEEVGFFKHSRSNESTKILYMRPGCNVDCLDAYQEREEYFSSEDQVREFVRQNIRSLDEKVPHLVQSTASKKYKLPEANPSEAEQRAGTSAIMSYGKMMQEHEDGVLMFKELLLPDVDLINELTHHKWTWDYCTGPMNSQAQVYYRPGTESRVDLTENVHFFKSLKAVRAFILKNYASWTQSIDDDSSNKIEEDIEDCLSPMEGEFSSCEVNPDARWNALWEKLESWRWSKYTSRPGSEVFSRPGVYRKETHAKCTFEKCKRFTHFHTQEGVRRFIRCELTFGLDSWKTQPAKSLFADMPEQFNFVPVFDNETEPFDESDLAAQKENSCRKMKSSGAGSGRAVLTKLKSPGFEEAMFSPGSAFSQSPQSSCAEGGIDLHASFESIWKQLHDNFCWTFDYFSGAGGLNKTVWFRPGVNKQNMSEYTLNAHYFDDQKQLINFLRRNKNTGMYEKHASKDEQAIMVHAESAQKVGNQDNIDVDARWGEFWAKLTKVGWKAIEIAGAHVYIRPGAQASADFLEDKHFFKSKDKVRSYVRRHLQDKKWEATVCLKQRVKKAVAPEATPNTRVRQLISMKNKTGWPELWPILIAHGWRSEGDADSGTRACIFFRPDATQEDPTCEQNRDYFLSVDGVYEWLAKPEGEKYWKKAVKKTGPRKLEIYKKSPDRSLTTAPMTNQVGKPSDSWPVFWKELHEQYGWHWAYFSTPGGGDLTIYMRKGVTKRMVIDRGVKEDVHFFKTRDAVMQFVKEHTEDQLWTLSYDEEQRAMKEDGEENPKAILDLITGADARWGELWGALQQLGWSWDDVKFSSGITGPYFLPPGRDKQVGFDPNAKKNMDYFFSQEEIRSYLQRIAMENLKPEWYPVIKKPTAAKHVISDSSPAEVMRTTTPSTDSPCKRYKAALSSIPDRKRNLQIGSPPDEWKQYGINLLSWSETWRTLKYHGWNHSIKRKIGHTYSRKGAKPSVAFKEGEHYFLSQSAVLEWTKLHLSDEEWKKAVLIEPDICGKKNSPQKHQTKKRSLSAEMTPQTDADENSSKKSPTLSRKESIKKASSEKRINTKEIDCGSGDSMKKSSSTHSHGLLIKRNLSLKKNLQHNADSVLGNKENYPPKNLAGVKTSSPSTALMDKTEKNKASSSKKQADFKDILLANGWKIRENGKFRYIRCGCTENGTPDWDVFKDDASVKEFIKDHTLLIKPWDEIWEKLEGWGWKKFAQGYAPVLGSSIVLPQMRTPEEVMGYLHRYPFLVEEWDVFWARLTSDNWCSGTDVFGKLMYCPPDHIQAPLAGLGNEQEIRAFVSGKPQIMGSCLPAKHFLKATLSLPEEKPAAAFVADAPFLPSNDVMEWEDLSQLPGTQQPMEELVEPSDEETEDEESEDEEMNETQETPEEALWGKALRLGWKRFSNGDGSESYIYVRPGGNEWGEEGTDFFNSLDAIKPLLPETPDKQLNVTLAKKKAEVLQCLKQANQNLQLAAWCGYPTHRKEELNQIKQFCLNKLDEEMGGIMYICGSPGVGKTFTLTAMLRSLKEELRQTSSRPEPQEVWVNAGHLGGDPQIIYQELYFSVYGEKSLKSTEEYLGQLTVKFNPSKRSASKSYIVIIDEMDMLMTRGAAVIRQLFEWAHSPTSALILLGISNTINFPEKVLSQLGNGVIDYEIEKVVFAVYTREQLEDILVQRVGDVASPDGLKLCAAKAASRSGDARNALDYCKSVFDSVITDLEELPLQHFEQPSVPLVPLKLNTFVKVLTLLLKDKTPAKIKDLPPIPQMLLCVGVAMFRKLSGEHTALEELSLYHTFRKSGVVSPDFSKPEFDDALGHIVESGLMVWIKRNPQPTHLTVLVSKEDLESALPANESVKRIFSLIF